MLGIVFTEFLELVEDKFGFEMVDSLITEAGSANDGAYTAVGAYDHTELVNMVVSLANSSGVEVPQLVETFGHHLFGRFSQLYPAFFENVPGAFEFLENVEDHIHVEVKKLYPEAQLPSVKAQRISEDKLLLTYKSSRCLSPLAEGLIKGCADHFKETLDVEAIPDPEANGSLVQFKIERKHG